MATGAKRHTHKYHKIDQLWHCALPDCTHFMPRNVAHNVEGKLSICWDCGKEFRLTFESMQDDKPICANCTNPELADVASFLKEKGAL